MVIQPIFCDFKAQYFVDFLGLIYSANPTLHGLVLNELKKINGMSYSAFVDTYAPRWRLHNKGSKHFYFPICLLQYNHTNVFVYIFLDEITSELIPQKLK